MVRRAHHDKGEEAGALVTLGAFAFSFGGVDLAVPPTQKARALLVYLVWNEGVEISRERIVEIFWSGADPERGRSSLNTALWSIRRCLRSGNVDDGDILAANKRSVKWLAAMSLDVRTFTALAQSEDSSARREAIALYGGDFLEGDYDDWSVAQRERASASYEAILSATVVSEGDVESGRRLIDRGAYDETPYALVARAERDAGRPAAAGAIVKRCRAALAEIGIQPSAEFDAEFAALESVVERCDAAIELPFCGRESELEAIANALERTVAGIGGVTLLIGTAGAGKSALLHRAERLARGAPMRVVAVSGIQDDPRPFGPWAACYEELSGKTLANVVAEGGGAWSLARDIAGAIGLPATVLVDDAHYLHADALHVLGAIAAVTSGTALQVVVATRSEAVRVLSASLPNAKSLEIGALSYEQLRSAIARIAPANVQPLAEFLFARSGGHALFAKELLESLAQGGAVRVRHGEWEIPEPLEGNANTPTTIRRFIEARLFAKGDDPATVACALALEASATAEDLVAVCDLGEERTLDAIDDLLALGLIDQPPRGVPFCFQHDLVREAAARALNVGRRVRLHRAFAQCFEGDESRSAAVRRAHHLRSSGDVAAAARQYAHAALAVFEVNGWGETMDLARTGIELARSLRPEPETHALAAQLHDVAAKACNEEGDIEGVRFHVDAYVRHARESTDPALTCWALTERAALLSDSLADLDHALIDAEEAATIARRIGDERLISRVDFRRSFCAQIVGDERGALDAARAALAARSRLGDSALDAAEEVRLLTVLSVWLHFDEAIEAGRRALVAAKRAGARIEASVRVTLAGLWFLLERWEEVRRELHVASQILEDAESQIMPFTMRAGEPLPFTRYRYRVQTGLFALAHRRWDEAARFGREVLSSPLVRSLEKRGVVGALVLGEALIGRNAPGDAQEAWETVRDVPQLVTANGLVGMSLYRAVTLARAAARLRRDDALALVEEAAGVLDCETARTPLDGDRAYALLAEAAAWVSAEAPCVRLRRRAAELRERRVRAAGDEWGGRDVVADHGSRGSP